MIYTPFAIANWYIKRAAKDGMPMSPMRLQKLVYFAHAWSLALFDRPLFNTDIGAWQYGPVIPELYHRYKIYGRESIPTGAIESQVQEVEDESIDSKLLEIVYQRYQGYTPIELSMLTHRPGSPWAEAQSKQSPYISNTSIKTYYQQLLAQGENDKQPT